MKTIEKYKMINDGDHIVVGFSGGVDSAVLLFTLKSISTMYHLTLTAVHVNHGLRDDATSDMAFCKSVCESMDIPIEIYVKDIRAEAKKRSVTVEEAGRLCRYEAFYETVKKVNGQKIAVAHNMNDQAETFLLNLTRGTGLKGLCGIPFVRNEIVRPLMECSRDMIEYFAKENNINFKTDYTNALNIYTRNKIRNKIIPFINEELKTDLINSIAKTTNILHEEEQYLNAMAEENLKQCLVKSDHEKIILSVEKINGQHSAMRGRVLRVALSKINASLKDINFEHIESILQLVSKSKTGKKICLPQNLMAEIEYTNLILKKQIDILQHDEFCYEVELNSSVFIKEIDKYFLISREKIITTNFKNVYTKTIDYDKIVGIFQIRTRRKGDKVYIEKVGYKKIKKILIDRKIPRNLREKILFLSDDNEIIAAFFNEKDEISSDKYKISKDTKNYLYIYCYSIN